jgi:hypothetical protein
LKRRDAESVSGRISSALLAIYLGAERLTLTAALVLGNRLITRFASVILSIYRLAILLGPFDTHDHKLLIHMIINWVGEEQRDTSPRADIPTIVYHLKTKHFLALFGKNPISFFPN